MSQHEHNLSVDYIVRQKEAMYRLRRLLGSDDFAWVAKMARSLRASGVAYGFETLSQLGAALEAYAKAHDRENAMLTISEIDRYLSQTRSSSIAA